jgi:hypothetical protein
VRELARVAHAEPEMLRRFQESVGVYEGVWYGDHACDEGDFERLMRNRDAMAADG